MEHSVIYAPGGAGMSIPSIFLAEMDRLPTVMGGRSARIVIVDIGKSGSGLCDKCEPFMKGMDDDAVYSPESV